MKRFMLIPVMISALMAVSSCTMRDDLAVEPADANVLRLSVTITQPGIQTVTRSTVLAQPGEEDVTSLHLLFFEPDTNSNGRYIDYVEVQNISSSGSTPISVDMTNHPLLAVGDPYRILVMANAGSDIYINGDLDTWMQRWEGMTANNVIAQAKAWIEGATDDSNAILPDRLLMTGSIDKARDQFDLQLKLTREVIRFDVYNNKSESHDLVSAEIWNAYLSTSIWGLASDYSTSVSRTERFYGVDNTANTTGVPGADGLGDLMGNIIGGLYCFENQVISPQQNDRLTTCLIVGLRERATDITRYYRVNINPEESAQVLSANNVYRLTIRSIGIGYETPARAYEAIECGLDYTINYWDMTNYGLIVQDGNSIISIPARTITISEEGGEFSYDIFTYNNSGSTSSLSLATQKYSPSDGSLSSDLEGNTLTVTATPLGADEISRRGALTVTYAGLEAAIDIVQNRGEQTFLKLHLPSDGLKALAPFPGIESGDIRVEASGPWTAELFMPDEGFTLDPDALDPIIAVKKLQSSSPLVSDNTFNVYTWSANPDDIKRDCFVVVTLDSDPANYAAVAQLVQNPTGGISIAPNVSTVTFNGMGTGLASLAGNYTDTFNVLPMVDNNVIADWGREIIPVGAYDDTAMFTFINEDHSNNVTAGNTIGIAAAGRNVSGRRYTATLRIYLSLDDQTYTDITLVQQPLGINLSPDNIPSIGIEGGQTGLISVVTDNSLTWSATITTNGVTSPDGRSLVHHRASLVDQSGDPIVPGTQYTTATKMRVIFPKVYYPNRDIGISATVTVNVEGMTTSATIKQTTLTARTMVAYGLEGSPAYGSLGDTYSQGWEGTSGGYGLAQIPRYSLLRVDNMTNVSAVPGSVDYLHVAAQLSGAAGTSYNWSAVNNFIDTRNGWTVLVSQDISGLNPMNNPNSPLKRNGAGYNSLLYSAAGGSYAHVYQDRETPSKLYQFVMNEGHTPLTPAQIDPAGFYCDLVYNSLPGPWPETAVVLMTKMSNDQHAMLVVDIPNKFLWIGESQIFWYSAYLTNNRGTFLDNLMYFIANASKYGTNFTDLLLEDDQPDAQPAPWDESWWGPNAGVPSK